MDILPSCQDRVLSGDGPLKLGAANENECKILQDNYDKDGDNFTGGFVTKDVCDFEYSIYCYSDGSGTLPSLFRS